MAAAHVPELSLHAIRPQVPGEVLETMVHALGKGGDEIVQVGSLAVWGQCSSRWEFWLFGGMHMALHGHCSCAAAAGCLTWRIQPPATTAAQLLLHIIHALPIASDPLQHYVAKTIENIVGQAGAWANRFATPQVLELLSTVGAGCFWQCGRGFKVGFVEHLDASTCQGYSQGSRLRCLRCACRR